MDAPMITALYAGILGLMSVVLSFFPGTMRGRMKVPIGDNGDQNLLLAMRRHANFTEYVPLALILIALLEMSGVGFKTIHILGAALVLSRIAHATGIKANTIARVDRAIGAGGTVLVIIVASIWLIVKYFSG